LTGNIPTEIGNLSNLGQLDLAYNQLIGSIPIEIGNLSNLTYLRLHDNQLSGCYDVNLWSLCHLVLYTNISSGNNFDESWDSFCSEGIGSCTSSE